MYCRSVAPNLITANVPTSIWNLIQSLRRLQSRFQQVVIHSFVRHVHRISRILLQLDPCTHVYSTDIQGPSNRKYHRVFQTKLNTSIGSLRHPSGIRDQFRFCRQQCPILSYTSRQIFVLRPVQRSRTQVELSRLKYRSDILASLKVTPPPSTRWIRL